MDGSVVRARASLHLLALLALTGCASLPQPRPGRHEGETPIPVPSMPDPGKPQVIPERPPALAHPVWIDGQWAWTGARWQWKEGGWEEQAPDRYYAPPIYVRLDDGSLVYLPGRWTSHPADD